MHCGAPLRVDPWIRQILVIVPLAFGREWLLENRLPS